MSDEIAEATPTELDPEELVELLRERMWESLDERERDEALTEFWRSNDQNLKELRPKLVRYLARALRFREIFVERAPAEKKAEFLKRVIRRDPFRFYCDDFIRAWLVKHRLPLLETFLDGASIENEDGYATTDEPPSVEQFNAGIAAASRRFNPRDVYLYVAYLGHFGGSSGFWDNLRETAGFQEAMERFTGIKPNALSLGDEVDSIEGEDAEPEATTEGFTRLDDYLIRLAVSTAFGEENSPGVDTLEDIVEEVVELNSHRQRSLFHRGFFDALFRREFRFSFPGENSERRQWYACGVIFGLLRHREVDRCIAILVEEQRELGAELSTKITTPCGAKILPELLKPLLEAGQYGFVILFVRNQFPRLVGDRVRAWVTNTVLSEAARLLRQGRYADAEGLVDLTFFILKHWVEMLPDGFIDAVWPEALRRKAQCLQAKGSFPTAREMLVELIENHHAHTPPNALADLGLIDGGFRSLAAVLPRSDVKSNGPLIEGLRRGAARFQEATERFTDRATNAHLCLGILKTLESKIGDQAQERADHFHHALAGMRDQPDAYAESGIRDWAESLLALALLETAEPSNYHPAGDYFPGIAASSVKFPVYLWERFFDASQYFDDPGIAIQTAGHLMQKRPEAAGNLLGNADLIARNESVLLPILRHFLEQRQSTPELWRKLVDLLPLCLRSRAFEAAELILDRLEDLALSHAEYRDLFIDILRDPGRYSPAWDASDADSILIQLYEMQSRPAEAAERLRSRFYALRAEENPQSLYEAREVVSRLKSLGEAGAFHVELESLIDEPLPEPTPDRRLSGTVLYVGGNETQRAYAERLRREIGELHPDLKISLHFTGWTSNWGDQLDRLRPSVEEADVVVINQLVRTHFGRGLRAMCGAGHPWLPCTGRGYDSLKRSILRAAAWAADHRE